MQPTELQVERSLAALLAEPDRAAGGVRRPTDAGEVALAPELPPGLVEVLATMPELRAERLAAARRWVQEGASPSDEDLAGRMVGRIVCDRLR